MIIHFELLRIRAKLAHLEWEGDGLGDAGEVDQDRGAHHCSLIVLEQEMRQKEACRKSSVCLVAAQVSTYEFVLTRRGKGF